MDHRFTVEIAERLDQAVAISQIPFDQDSSGSDCLPMSFGEVVIDDRGDPSPKESLDDDTPNVPSPACHQNFHLTVYLFPFQILIHQSQRSTCCPAGDISGGRGWSARWGLGRGCPG